jgi:hypothetical protein
MADEDEYNKDSNHNAEVDRRETNRLMTIITIAVLVFAGIFFYYYFTEIHPPHRIPPIVPSGQPNSVQPQPVPKTPNQPHPYDHTLPPDKQ